MKYCKTTAEKKLILELRYSVNVGNEKRVEKFFVLYTKYLILINDSFLMLFLIIIQEQLHRFAELL